MSKPAKRMAPYAGLMQRIAAVQDGRTFLGHAVVGYSTRPPVARHIIPVFTSPRQADVKLVAFMRALFRGDPFSRGGEKYDVRRRRPA